MSTRRRDVAMRATGWAVGLTLLIALVAACGGGLAVSSVSASAKPAGASPLPLAPGQRRALAARYLAIAVPANVRLDSAVTRFREDEWRDLAAAAADLKEQASTERRFDRELLGIAFPGQLEPVALQLVRTNEARADLALREATSTSLVALASFAPAQAAADALVEERVNIIRRQLGLPPADQS